MVFTRWSYCYIGWEITQIPWHPELCFLCMTGLYNLVYNCAKYHQYISKGIGVMVITRFCPQTDVQADGRTDRQMDARLIAISPEPNRSGDKKLFARKCQFQLQDFFLSQKLPLISRDTLSTAFILKIGTTKILKK